MEKADQIAPVRSWRDPILLLLFGTVIGLTLLEGGLFAIYRQGPALGEWPSFIPMMYGFIVLVSICIAFLAFGRYQAAREMTFYWVGLGFASFGLAQIFYILSWPGLLPDNRSLIARLPGTSLWIGEYAKTFLIITLLAATVTHWPLENSFRGRRWLAWLAGGIGLTALVCGLMVLGERNLPVAIQGSGHFTMLALTWEGVLVIVIIIEVFLFTRLYRTAREPFLGYLAVALTAFAFGAATALIGTKRYDLWFYLYRVIFVYCLLILLFGLLLEFPRLIRQEREAQARIAAEREWFQTTLASIGDAVITTDARGKISYLNAVAERLTGWKDPEAYGLAVEQVVHFSYEPIGLPVTHSGFEEAQRYAVTGLSGHTTIVNRTGQSIPIVETSAPIRVGSSPPQGMVIVLHDMTEKHKAEQVLAESEARYRNLFNSLTEGFALHEILIKDDGTPYDYRFLEINPAFEQLTGLKRENVVGKIFSQVLPDEGTKWVEKYGKVALTGEPIHFEDYSQTLKQYYDVFAYRPSPGQFATIFLNITERKQAGEEALSRAVQIELQHRLLEQRERERQEIARDLHDGPVQDLTRAAIDVQSMLLDEQNPDTRQKLEALRICLQSQIGDLRAYAGELRPPALEKFGLGKAIRSHLDTFQEKNTEIQVDFEEAQVGELIPVDKRLAMFRIYQETMNNIVKHARATRVIIRLQKTDGQVYLEIQDNGVGFEVPKDWLELARQKHLGLVGIRERAEAVGGEVEIHSQKGRGTRVAVRVPIDSSPEDISAV